MNDVPQAEIQHALSTAPAGSHNSTTYCFRSSVGPKLYVILTFDEFYVIKGMMINHEASGTSLHNICNAIGRIISLGIQEIRKIKPNSLYDYILKQVENLSGFSSDVLWMNDDLGNAQSIPDVLALILKRHVAISEAVDELHSGEEEECDIQSQQSS